MDFVLLGAVFSLVMGVSLYLNWQGRYISQPLLFSGYFFLAAVLVVYLFPSALALIPLFPSILFTLCAYAVAIAGYALTRHAVRRPAAFIARYGTKNAFIRLEYPFLLTKGFEIGFQQLCFAAFVLLLSRQGLALPQLALASAGMLFALHVPLWQTHGVRWGSFYVVSAVILGLLFPYIVFLPAGLSLTFSIHLLAYVAAGAALWVVQKRKTVY